MFSFVNKNMILVAAGLAGVCFVGYCVYFDKKRRSDPDYKKKVRERRARLAQQQEERMQQELREQNELAARELVPDLPDHDAMERYFLQEIQAGETKITQGDYDGGVEHFANAIFVCSQPAKLLEMLESSLPTEIFGMLIVKMRDKGDRLQAEMMEEIYTQQSTLMSTTATTSMSMPPTTTTTTATMSAGGDIGASGSSSMAHHMYALPPPYELD